MDYELRVAVKIGLLFIFPIALFAQGTVVGDPWDNIFNGSALACLIGIISYLFLKELPAMRREAREEREKKDAEAKEERIRLAKDFKEALDDQTEQLKSAVDRMSDTIELHNKEHK